jgi:hypothetical protein
MMENFLATVGILFDYVSAIAPHGVIGGIVFISGFLILAIGIDRVRVRVDNLTNDVRGLIRKIDSLTLAIQGRRGGPHLDEKNPTVEAGDSEASLEDIRKRLEALSAWTTSKG